MSISGLCQICESAEATHSCPQCGTRVCDTHYDREQGICARCASTMGGQL